MSYFSHFGSAWVNLNGSNILINDITTFATLDKTWREDARFHIPYQIKDGDMPHNISERLYDTVDYWWTILLMNDIYDLDEQWPRTQDQMNRYLSAKYQDKNLQSVHHYINPQGLVADLLSLRIELGLSDNDEVIYQAGLEAVTIEEYEYAVNESKRNIKLVDPDFISQVQLEFEKSMGMET